MSDATQGTWFYSKDGSQEGPVSFAELQAKARDGALNPRLDMAWTSGMADWKPTGEIEGLFEKRVSLPAPTPSGVPVNPYQAPAYKDSFELGTQNGEWPGARRRTYYLMTILFPFVWNFLFAFGAGFFGQQLGPEMTGMITVGGMFVPFILAIYFGLSRLVNLGMSRWWYLGNFVPILNFWVAYRMLVCPAGYAVHKKLDTIGVILAILYGLMLLLMILAIAGICLAMFGMVGDPELRKQFEEALKPIFEEFNKP